VHGQKTVVQRKKRVAPERDDCRFLGFSQNRRVRFRRASLHILDRRALPPLRHRLRVDAEFLAQLGSEAQDESTYLLRYRTLVVAAVGELVYPRSSASSFLTETATFSGDEQ
jgi:hypothetical protein